MVRELFQIRPTYFDFQLEISLAQNVAPISHRKSSIYIVKWAELSCSEGTYTQSEVTHGRELDVSWVNFLCSFDLYHFYCNLTLLIIDSRAVKSEEIT